MKPAKVLLTSVLALCVATVRSGYDDEEEEYPYRHHSSSSHKHNNHHQAEHAEYYEKSFELPHAHKEVGIHHHGPSEVQIGIDVPKIALAMGLGKIGLSLLTKLKLLHTASKIGLGFAGATALGKLGLVKVGVGLGSKLHGKTIGIGVHLH